MKKSSPAVPLLGFPGKVPMAADLPTMRNGEVQRLLGFWIMWHRYGGVHGLMASGMMAESSIYRQVNDFRTMFGLDVWAVPADFPVYASSPSEFFEDET